ncbi:hypothetical protein IGB42_03587 [Andreprevotia sp. IGB-42]|uniref:GNAT family N-acetyltransferase n=1 Tax=Andreprevotia sp. IGB-42 TaxID=2497473 RepID=UPI00135B0E4B|nr:GNAT family N-acetyltransferase [Andreprevotia sp. IGB-42]KAF0812045.1 hypothetical protein IGB42_03587 [Andreprevotia sp. IGB-42]
MTAVDFILRAPRADEYGALAALVHHTFDVAVAPRLEQAGRATFYAYALADAIADRDADSHLTLVAERDGKVLGMVQFKLPDHLCMLFVEPAEQGRGLGRALTEAAIAKACAFYPALSIITVNASPNAVPAYLRFGFVATSGEQIVNGIRFVAMQRLVLDA